MLKVDPLSKGIYGAGVGVAASSVFCVMKKSEDISTFINSTIKPIKAQNNATPIKNIPKYITAVISKTPEKIHNFIKSKNKEDKSIKKFMVLFTLFCAVLGYFSDKNRENKLINKNKSKNPS